MLGPMICFLPLSEGDWKDALWERWYEISRVQGERAHGFFRAEPKRVDSLADLSERLFNVTARHVDYFI